MNEDRGTRYQRLRRRGAVLSAAWTLALLGGATFSGASRGVREAGEVIAGSLGLPPILTSATSAAVLGLVLFVTYELGATPLAFFGQYAIDRRYGLSTLPAWGWLTSRLETVLIGGTGVLAVAALWPLWVDLFARAWWGATWLVVACGAVMVAWGAPVWLLPRFYRFTPLERPALAARLADLANRAGVVPPDVVVWHLGGAAPRARAAMTGMGRTRRVLLSDTLLDDFSDDEIEVIVAHEIAHDVRGDVWWSLAGRGLVMGGALWMAQQALTRLPEPFWRQRPGDPESLPLAALVTFVGVGCCRPILLAMSRWHERQADRLALELTNQPDAFISAVQRMSTRNLSDEEPTTWQRVLFSGHPPVRERLARARALANRGLSEPSPPARRSSSGSPRRS